MIVIVPDRLRLLSSSNLVDDIRQAEFLALCPSLTSLTLEGNPVTRETFV